MTRSSKLALVTLLAALLSIATVGASAPCTCYAQERCEQMAAAHDTALFRIAASLALSGNPVTNERSIFTCATAGSFRYDIDE